LVGATTLQQVLGRSPFDFVHSDFQLLVHQRLALLHKTTTVRLSEMKLVRLDGTPIDVEVVASSNQENGEPVIQLFCRSISKQRWLAEHVDAADEPPYRSLKTEAIGHVAAEIAHDFNNLLTVLTAYADAVESCASLPAELRDLSCHIRKTTEDLGELARRLLHFGRNEPIAPQVLNVNKLVSALQRALSQAAGNRVQVTTTLAAQNGLIKVDSTQLEQVLLNLTINARDAMPDGGALTIETHNIGLTEEEVQHLPGRRAGTYVSLVVRDTGVGMDAATQPLIFEPYFTTKQPNQGIGLGLESVFSLVRQNAGLIRVDSQPGHGTSFIMHFPTANPGAAPI
jgi:signal transduction histidine kinase